MRSALPPLGSHPAIGTWVQPPNIGLDASVPAHVMTLDWLGGDSGTFAVSWRSAAPHTTWAFTNAKDSRAIHTAGIKTLYYTQPNRQAPGEPEYTTDNSTFAHDCNGKRIPTTNFADHYLMYPGSTHLGLLWQQEVATVTGAWHGSFDAIYEDLSDTIVYTAARPCGFDQTAWTAQSNAMIGYVKALGEPVYYNGLAVFSKDGGVSNVTGLNVAAAGGMLEGCYVTNGSFPRLHSKTWLATERTELRMAQDGRQFMCEGMDNASASSAIGDRLYYYASLLLTLDTTSAIDVTEFSTPNGFHVLPETEFVPQNPAFPVLWISQLQQSTNLYARQYDHCYLAQVDVGACAVAVNVDVSTSHQFPWAGQYRHTLALSGDDILERGKASVGSSAPPAMMKPLTAVIAIH